MGQEGNSAFSAFVSYSHADKKAAQKLHRKLEGYRLPKHVIEQLAGRDRGNGGAADGKADGRLGQIFRDREDLPAAQDLSESVKEALTGSAALVVLCSPAAKASPWVAREIELFRELHPDRPILAALLEGEPADAFPGPLTQGKEPLAADLRKEGDGPRLGFLKIVAGIAGVPLDALVQRDAQRRLRRVTMITGGAVLAMLAMAIMTFIAIQSRNEAQRQRVGAEGLVEYMYTDLGPQLRGVGRLDVMEGVNRRAMQYFDGQGDISDLPDDSLQHRAGVLLAMGENYEKLGKLEKASVKFSEAHGVTKTLLKRDTNNPDRIYGHAQSEYWVGYAAWEKSNHVKTLKHWKAYRKLAANLSEVEKHSSRGLLELGYSEGNLCTYYLRDNNDLPAAKRHCRLATQYLEQANALYPEDTVVAGALANRLGWFARYHARNMEYRQALAMRKRETKIMDNLLHRDPKNKEYLMRRLWSLSGQGEQQAQLGNMDAAVDMLSQAEAGSRKLLAIDGNSIDYLVTRLRILIRSMEIYKRARSAKWRYFVAETRGIFEKISKIDPQERRELSAQFSKFQSIIKGGVK